MLYILDQIQFFIFKFRLTFLKFISIMKMHLEHKTEILGNGIVKTTIRGRNGNKVSKQYFTGYGQSAAEATSKAMIQLKNRN